MFKPKLETLTYLISELESYIPLKNKRDGSISTSDVGWQIDHSLKVFNLVSETLLNSDPDLYSSKFNIWRLIYFTLGYFPRGKVKAPRFVRPPEEILEKNLQLQIEIAHNHIIRIQSANTHNYFKHFIFGILNKKRTIQFLNLHTTHHLKIIREILN